MQACSPQHISQSSDWWRLQWCRQHRCSLECANFFWFQNTFQLSLTHKIRPQLHLYLWRREGGEQQRTQLASMANTKTIVAVWGSCASSCHSSGTVPCQLCSCVTDGTHIYRGSHWWAMAQWQHAQKQKLPSQLKCSRTYTHLFSYCKMMF